MKNLKIILLALFLSLIILSCQEDFNPKTDFKEKYILDSYIDLDYDNYKATYIYATVTKLYDVEGFDTSKNKIDPYVSGAGISVYYRGDNFQLKEYNGGIIAKRPPPVFQYKYYYSSRLDYIYPNYPISITAVLPGGKVLSSNIQLLSGLQLGFSYNFERGFTTKINRFLFGNVFTIDWGYADGCLFFPKLVIQYRRKDTGYTIYYKEVPCTYINRNGHSEPVYPSPINGSSISYDYSAIDSAMAQVSHVENFDYYTGYIIFQMIEMDRALSNYYESIHGSADSYSISLDQPVYSNISGGLGIFGSKRTISKWWNLDPNYIARFLQKK
ncbi:MAG: DUF4249 domain-containing protein [Bacteroidetes bacterium]|nr:DUF4249 domain-containing protein [Bacteroidota bacterium]